MAFDVFKRTAPKPGPGAGRNGAALNDGAKPQARPVSRDEGLEGKLVVQRRHVDWLEHQIRWRWLMDSHEGGERYRNAVYGPDRRGLPCRNLFRHKREYPDPQQFPQVNQGFGGFLGTGDVQSQGRRLRPVSRHARRRRGRHGDGRRLRAAAGADSRA